MTRLHEIMAKTPLQGTAASILDHGFGEVLLQSPDCACLRVTDFHLLEGPMDAAFGTALLERMRFPALVISSGAHWYAFLRERKGSSCETVKRVLYVWGKDPAAVEAHVRAPLEAGFEVRRIAKEDALRLDGLEWSAGVFESFGGIDDFLKRGSGFCVAFGERIVALCISYSYSDLGVEIEVDTDPDYQRRGLGKIVSAHFIAGLLGQGKIPLWDATNPASAKIAEALGFVRVREYEALEIEPA